MSYELPKLRCAKVTHDRDIQRPEHHLQNKEVPGVQLDFHQPRSDRGRGEDPQGHPGIQAQKENQMTDKKMTCSPDLPIEPLDEEPEHEAVFDQIMSALSWFLGGCIFVVMCLGAGIYWRLQ